MDAERATYVNVLFNSDVTNFVGSFTCVVRNVRGIVQETTILNGEEVATIQREMVVGILFGKLDKDHYKWMLSIH